MGLRYRILGAILLVAALGGSLTACAGGSSPADSLLSNIDKARSARTLSTLEQGLIAVQTTAAESSGAADAPTLAVDLQQHDASNRYTTAPPTDAGIIQVVGGAGSPIMLVGITAPPTSPKPPAYLALWESGGSTLYYIGPSAPQYSSSAPSGAGWSTSPPQA